MAWPSWARGRNRRIFNPYYANQVIEMDITTATEGGLVTVTDDLRYMPDQATGVPTVANGGVVIHSAGDVTVKWRLRPGLLWSDGQPLTCDDYSFTNDWILDPANTGLSRRQGRLPDAGRAPALRSRPARHDPSIST